MKVLRLTDGKSGATLGKVYGLCSQMDELYREPIAGLDDGIRERLHMLFMARWAYFHTPVFTAAHFLEPEYIHVKPTAKEKAELHTVFKAMATTQHTFSALVADYAQLETAVCTNSNGMDDELAFSARAKKMPSFEWGRTYLYFGADVQWAQMRLTAIGPSASPCEHSWSIEGWIHSKKRNRLGQTNVERLVRTHTNLILEAVLEDWRPHVLPWEIEVIIEEPEPESECDCD